MKIRKVIIIFSALLLICSCGKKGDPYPKDTLNIPAPSAVQFTLEDDGLKITNPLPNNEILVERSESDIGALSFPFYDTIARIQPGESFVDNTTEEGMRYTYRVRSRDKQYDAYSAPVSRTVSYTRAVDIEDVKWTVKDNKLCLDISVSKNVKTTKVTINGKESKPDKNQCYVLPALPRVLLVVVPYSATGIQGDAYSATIDRDINTLLPPQNVRVIRRVVDGQTQITLSWAPVAKADNYIIAINEKGGKTTKLNIDNTIYTWRTDSKECVDFDLATQVKGKVSENARVTSCP